MNYLKKNVFFPSCYLLFYNYLFIFLVLASGSAFAKGQKYWFGIGVDHYMSSRCSEALEPLYQASLLNGPKKSLAHLYLAHCQSVFSQKENAAYNLSMVNPEMLTPADRALYDSLIEKHKGDMTPQETSSFSSLLAYVGQTSHSPNTNKSSANFVGLAGTHLWKYLSFGLGVESLKIDLKPSALKDYSQSMALGQIGYFWTPSIKTSLSATSINTSSSQMKSVFVPGIQADFYWSAVLRFFVEYYTSSYSKLLADTAGTYKYPVDVRQAVFGAYFPLMGGVHKGVSGSLTMTAISLETSKDRSAVIPKTLNKDASRVEGAVFAWLGKNSLTLQHWVGTEVLGVRDRGAVVNNGTDRKIGGSKISLDRTVGSHTHLGVSYAPESYESIDYTTQAKKEFSSASISLKAGVFW